jgi:8-oxo-dGTP pyrophosphatase MutT (NUDIX family)
LYEGYLLSVTKLRLNMTHFRLRLRLMSLPVLRNIRRLWAKRIKEVSAGTIVFYSNGNGSSPLFLLIERGEPFNDWIFPKGKIKANEDIKSAALRETKEETGLDVIIYNKIRTYTYTYYWDPTNKKATKTVHYFLAQSRTNRVNSVKTSDEKREAATFKQIKFVDVEEAMQLVKHQVEKDILREAAQAITEVAK